MSFHYATGTTRWAFGSLADLMAKATPSRSGDMLAGIAASCAEENVAAKLCLADMPLKRFLEETLIPYEADEITRLIIDTHDRDAFAPIAHLTVGEFRDFLLSDEATPEIVSALAPASRRRWRRPSANSCATRT
jgi:ethanolamine ammonia-lyase large subunit